MRLEQKPKARRRSRPSKERQGGLSRKGRLQMETSGSRKSLVCSRSRKKADSRTQRVRSTWGREEDRVDLGKDSDQ